MSYPTSKKISEAEKLHNDYRSYFGGKYSASKSKSLNSDNKTIWTILKMSKCRLIMLFGVWFVIVMFILYKYKPKYVLQPKKTYGEMDKISMYNLFKYSFGIAVFLFVVSLFLAYRYPKLKSIIFKADECGMCRE